MSCENEKLNIHNRKKISVFAYIFIAAELLIQIFGNIWPNDTPDFVWDVANAILMITPVIYGLMAGLLCLAPVVVAELAWAVLFGITGPVLHLISFAVSVIILGITGDRISGLKLWKRVLLIILFYELFLLGEEYLYYYLRSVFLQKTIRWKSVSETFLSPANPAVLMIGLLFVFLDNRDKGKIGKKIIIIGCSGSGKSTLAVKLHERTGLPLFHLDSIWWREDKTHISREEFDLKLREILDGENWIIDGDYSRTYEMRFISCDTVIFLDYSREECMSGITERVGKMRKDIPFVDEELDRDLVKVVEDYGENDRPVILNLMEKYPEKRYIILRSRDEADKWISDI